MAGHWFNFNLFYGLLIFLLMELIRNLEAINKILARIIPIKYKIKSSGNRA